jgi:predicted HicB family RNase H-like nuclease
MADSVVRRLRAKQRQNGSLPVVRPANAQPLDAYLDAMGEQGRESQRLTEQDFVVRVNERG